MFLLQNIQSEHLILGIFLVPLLGAFVAFYLGTIKEFWRDIFAGIVAFCAFFFSLLLFLETLLEPVSYSVGWFMMLGLEFHVTPLGAFMALISSFVWFLATMFSWVYMEHEHSRSRYYFFLLLTEAGCLGVFLAGDLFTLFLFFETMSVASYMLVVHKEKPEALSAGQNYLYLGITGGLALLLGIIILNGYMGTTEIASLTGLMEQARFPGYLAVFLMVIGFGIKAGMVPLHIWLPKAHPVAPSPASALLSGIMIKTGAYGILLITNLLFASPIEGHIYDYTRAMGFILIWIAVTTMFSAAFMALFQSNVKRTLAYSSISQMGFILLGIGCAAYMGSEGMMGFTGSIYYILNHAFFKAGMFMMVGAVYHRTHQLELSKLGGFIKEFPLTAFAFVVAACGIAGVPLFNGYASKTLVHHAIEDAYYYGGHESLYYAEIMFAITCTLTVTYIFKITRGIFFGIRKESYDDIDGETFLERMIFTAFAGIILVIGFMPHKVLRGIIIPLSQTFTFEADNVAYLADINLWVLQDLLNVTRPVAIGLVIYYFMNRAGLFEMKFPHWLSIEYLVYRPVVQALLNIIETSGTILDGFVDNLYKPLALKILYVFKGSGAILDGFVENLYRPLMRILLNIIQVIGAVLDGLFDKTFVEGGKPGMAISRSLASFDSDILPQIGVFVQGGVSYILNFIYVGWIRILNYYTKKLKNMGRKMFFALIKADYDTKGDPFYQVLNPYNYNFDLFVVWLVLLLLLSLIVIF